MRIIQSASSFAKTSPVTVDTAVMGGCASKTAVGHVHEHGGGMVGSVAPTARQQKQNKEQNRRGRFPATTVPDGIVVATATTANDESSDEGNDDNKVTDTNDSDKSEQQHQSLNVDRSHGYSQLQLLHSAVHGGEGTNNQENESRTNTTESILASRFATALDNNNTVTVSKMSSSSSSSAADSTKSSSSPPPMKEAIQWSEGSATSIGHFPTLINAMSTFSSLSSSSSSSAKLYKSSSAAVGIMSMGQSIILEESDNEAPTDEEGSSVHPMTSTSCQNSVVGEPPRIAPTKSYTTNCTEVGSDSNIHSTTVAARSHTSNWNSKSQSGRNIGKLNVVKWRTKHSVQPSSVHAPDATSTTLAIKRSLFTTASVAAMLMYKTKTRTI